MMKLMFDVLLSEYGDDRKGNSLELEEVTVEELLQLTRIFTDRNYSVECRPRIQYDNPIPAVAPAPFE